MPKFKASERLLVPGRFTLPDDLVSPVPSDAEIELIASMLGELMLLVLRFNDSEDD